MYQFQPSCYLHVTRVIDDEQSGEYVAFCSVTSDYFSESVEQVVSAKNGTSRGIEVLDQTRTIGADVDTPSGYSDAHELGLADVEEGLRVLGLLPGVYNPEDEQPDPAEPSVDTTGEVLSGQANPKLGVHTEEQYTSGKLVRRTRYIHKASNGTLSGKAYEELFNYTGNKLMSTTVKTFTLAGDVLTETTFYYQTETTGSGVVVTKKKA